MTERGLPSMDGSPACPFVAFDDDRDARADRPDHRHRCFAEPAPAPRALAHQEAYCLSSAFPVCPTFQAWARREAAQARTDKAAADAGAAAAAAATAAADANVPGGAAPGDERGADEWTPGAHPVDDVPIESRPRRNPPRDWAAPPPWASGAGAGATGAGSTRPTGASAGSGGSADSGSGSGTGPGSPRSGEPPAFITPPAEGRGLAGSAADRLASGEPIDHVIPSVVPPSRPQDLPSAGPDPELAGLVGSAAAASASGRPGTDDALAAASYPPSTRSGRRPAVSSTRPPDRGRDRPPQRERVQSDGPSWEHPRRYEAYPTIKNRGLPGMPGMPGLPRFAILAGALGIAAIALFFLPALLGVGGGGGTSPTPSATVRPTASPSPTPEPEPTPQVYTIKEGDTLSKIAKKYDLTLDQLLEANKDTIEDPDKISVGDEIIIPVPPPDEVSGDEESIAP